MKITVGLVTVREVDGLQMREVAKVRATATDLHDRWIAECVCTSEEEAIRAVSFMAGLSMLSEAIKSLRSNDRPQTA